MAVLDAVLAWANTAGAGLVAPVPWLPAPVVLRWGWPLMWAALGAGLLWGGLGRWGARRHRWDGGPVARGGLGRGGRLSLAACGLWAVLALWPAPWSPVQALGLAFQAPSGFAVAAAWAWALTPRGAQGLPSNASLFVAISAVLTGATLLFDGYIWGGSAVYAWGFSALAWLAAGVWVAVFALLWGAHPGGRRWVLALALALGLGALTRLPTGNAWALVNDPWLSLWALAWALQAAIRGAAARFAATPRWPR